MIVGLNTLLDDNIWEIKYTELYEHNGISKSENYRSTKYDDTHCLSLN